MWTVSKQTSPISKPYGPTCDNVDTVIHMAAYLEDNFDAHLAVNVRGTYNVFEAARQASARRIVLASSGAITYHYETEEPYLSLVEARWNDVDDDVVPHRSPITDAAQWPLQRRQNLG